MAERKSCVFAVSDLGDWSFDHNRANFINSITVGFEVAVEVSRGLAAGGRRGRASAGQDRAAAVPRRDLGDRGR